MNVEDLYRAEVLSQWLAETDRALSALRAWRSILETWQSGATTVDPGALNLALSLLGHAGLAEWAEWCPAGGGLDSLAMALKATVVCAGHGDDVAILDSAETCMRVAPMNLSS